MREPLVTIVTPSYNQGEFIRATIESVLRQDYPAIEYIIVDGGSTDRTAAVVAEYAGRLRWISENDRGQSHAINKGFRLARGEIVAWLNSDDTLLDGAVSSAVRAFVANPRAGAVYGEGYLMDRQGSVTGRFPHTEPLNLWKLVHLSDYILQQSVFFRKEIVDELGGLDEDLHYTMDWDLLIRIGKRRPLHYIPEYLGCLREYPEAKSFSGGPRRIREIAGLLRRHTGMWLPPGLVIYGLETYRQLWCRRIEGLTPRALRRVSAVLQWLIRVGCGYLIERAIWTAQGWYPDGWASPRVRCMLPPGEGPLVIEGSLPETNTDLRGQVIRVWSGGVTIAEAAVPAGEFRLSVGWPAGSTTGPVEFELRAARSFRPSAPEPARYGRRLAYVLRSVGWGRPEDAITPGKTSPHPPASS